MGKIMKNDIPYGGSSGNASSVKYDNTTSGLQAGNVQGAVDEITNSFRDYNNEQIVGILDNTSVYRKYIKININLSETSSLVATKIAHGIEGISRIINWELSFINNSNLYIYAVPYFGGDGKCHTYISSINQSEIDIVNDISWNGYSLQGFIYYLKNS